MRENGGPELKEPKQRPMDSLLPQPGQVNPYKQKFHPLPGTPEFMQKAIRGESKPRESRKEPKSELQKALAAEKARIDASMREQGVIPGKAIYENPRQNQNTLLPTEKYASG